MKEDMFAPYYLKIANQLNSIMPVEWYDLVLYGEELGDNRTAQFYFRTEENGEYIRGGKIPDLYGVNQNIYLGLMSELYLQIKELKQEFLRQGLPEWKTMTFWLDCNFKFKTEFSYDIDMKTGSYERGIYWAYKTLGIVPQDSFGKSVLDEYLSAKE